MRTIPFYKMVASGNDFIVIDNRRGLVKNPALFAKTHCPNHTAVGADGLLLLEKSSRGAFKMRIVNADGSEAEACGNGFRCIALYARQVLKLPAEFNFESLSGKIRAKVHSDRVAVGLIEPFGLKKRGELQVMGHRLHYSFLNTGVPHAVIFVQGIEKVDVESLGRSVRRHSVFGAKGTNVNFVEVRGPHEIRVRTYERGVEAETLACGTGATASAILSAVMGYVDRPVKVHTRGGEKLVVDFQLRGEKITGVTLEGEARFVYEGKLYV